MGLMGGKMEEDWDGSKEEEKGMVCGGILVREGNMKGKRVGEVDLRSMYGVKVRGVKGWGMELFGGGEVGLEVGEGVMVVGGEDGMEGVGKLVGKELGGVEEGKMVSIFVGIVWGMVLGSLGIGIGGMGSGVKLGVGGGGVIICIVIGGLGDKVKVVR